MTKIVLDLTPEQKELLIFSVRSEWTHLEYIFINEYNRNNPKLEKALENMEKIHAAFYAHP